MSSDHYLIAVLAEHGGLCPICCRLIVPGRSHVSPIQPRIQPDPELLIYAAQTRVWTVNGIDQVRIQARGWGHSRCVKAFEAKHSPWDRVTVALERRSELKRIKAEADHEYRDATRTSKSRRSAQTELDHESAAA